MERDEERDEDGGDLALFWQGEKPKFFDSRRYRTYQAAREHTHKIKYARKAARRAAGKGDPAAWTRFERRRAEIIGAFAAKKARIDADCDATEAKAAERRAKADASTAASAGPRLEADARRLGLILEIDRDTVGARKQGSGRFSRSTARVEMRQDERTLYLTAQGDEFELTVKVDSDDEDRARQFVDRYNTASAKAAQAHSSHPADGVPVAPVAAAPEAGLAGQLALLASLHDSGALSDDEFATAKARLLGTPQDAPPSGW